MLLFWTLGLFEGNMCSPLSVFVVICIRCRTCLYAYIVVLVHWRPRSLLSAPIDTLLVLPALLSHSRSNDCAWKVHTTAAHTVCGPALPSIAHSRNASKRKGPAGLGIQPIWPLCLKPACCRAFCCPLCLILCEKIENLIRK